MTLYSTQFRQLWLVTTRAKGLGKCCLMCGPVKPFENENNNNNIVQFDLT